jgi:RNA methyltransferase, TrmH family
MATAEQRASTRDPADTARILTSVRNPRVVDAAGLLRRRNRDRSGRYLLEGPRYVADLIAWDPALIDEVFVTPTAVAPLAAPAEAAGVRLTVVAEEVLARLADSATPQGVVAVVRQRRTPLQDVIGDGYLVVLVGVSDPGNAGAVVRTAVAAGSSGIVLTAGSVDPWNPKAVRASAGTIARLPLVVGVSVDEVIVACRDAGQRTVALDPAGPASIDDPAVIAPPVALLLGNEAHGLPPEVLRGVDAVAAVPRYGPVESLNLAAAAAVAVYAAARVGASTEPEASG